MKTFNRILPAVIVAVVMAFMFGSCGEIEASLSKADYASAVVSIYSDYSKKFDEISQAIQSDQTVTIGKLCDEAEDILDQIDPLLAPLEFKDEHKKIIQCCDNEKEKLELQKEYVTLLKSNSELTDEQTERKKEIEDRMSELSLLSGKFYNEVNNLASQALPTQTTTDPNMLNW